MGLEYVRLGKAVKERFHRKSLYVEIICMKFLIIALMVEMGIFTALALFLKPLH